MHKVPHTGGGGGGAWEGYATPLQGRGGGGGCHAGPWGLEPMKKTPMTAVTHGCLQNSLSTH